MGIFYNPPPPFQGGRQPLEQRKLTPPSVDVATSSDNPPFGQLDTIVDPWLEAQRQPPRPVGIASLIPTVVADVFVPLGRMLVAAATTIAVSSYAAAAMPQMPGKLNPSILDNPPAATTSDNPPFGLLETNVDPWVGEFRLPQTSRHLVQSAAQAQVDNPPVRSTAALQANTVQQWQPPFPQVITVYVTLQEGTAAPSAQVDNPPVRRHQNRLAIEAWWYTPPPQPTLPQKLVQPGVGEPPGELWGDIVAISTFKGLPQQKSKLPPSLLDNPPVPPVVDNPPLKTFARLQANIVAQWQPPFPQIVTVYVTLQEGQTVAAQVDNPPPLHRTPDAPVIYLAPPQQSGKLNPAILNNPPAPAVVDNPPLIRVGNQELVVKLWQPPDPLPTLGVKLNGSLLDNPTVVTTAVGKIYARRISKKQFEKERLERFSDKYYAELFGLERAVEAAEAKVEDAKNERKEALEEAVEAAESALEEASEREARAADLRAIARALDAAASARKSSEAITRANQAAQLARILIDRLEQEEREEEEAIELLLLS